MMDLNSMPRYWGVILVGLMFIGVVIWYFFYPRTEVYKGAPDKAKWRDVRLWAIILMAIQVLLYYFWR